MDTNALLQKAKHAMMNTENTEAIRIFSMAVMKYFASGQTENAFAATHMLNTCQTILRTDEFAPMVSVLNSIVMEPVKGKAADQDELRFFRFESPLDHASAVSIIEQLGGTYECPDIYTVQLTVKAADQIRKWNEGRNGDCIINGRSCNHWDPEIMAKNIEAAEQDVPISEDLANILASMEDEKAFELAEKFEAAALKIQDGQLSAYQNIAKLLQDWFMTSQVSESLYGEAFDYLAAIYDAANARLLANASDYGENDARAYGDDLEDFDEWHND